MDYGTITLFLIFGILIYMNWSIYNWIDREF
jgi:hypothetical protein